MTAMNTLAQRWRQLATRERRLLLAAAAVIAGALVYAIGIQPAWRVLAAAPAEHARLDVQWQRMQQLAAQVPQPSQVPQAQGQATALAPGNTIAALEAAVRQRLGAQARLQVTGERASVSFSAVPPDALARWLQDARINARALPAEARLTRNAAGQWDGTVVMALPAP